MPAKNFEEWVPFLNDVLTYWDQNDLPATATITMGGKEVTRADIVAMRDGFMPFDERIKQAERVLEKLQDERVASASEIQSFGVNFLAAMKGRFGASSQIAKNCPVVTKRRQSGGSAAGNETKKAAG